MLKIFHVFIYEDGSISVARLQDSSNPESISVSEETRAEPEAYYTSTTYFKHFCVVLQETCYSQLISDIPKEERIYVYGRSWIPHRGKFSREKSSCRFIGNEKFVDKTFTNFLHMITGGCGMP